MNILLIGKFSEGQFGFHISDTLRDMGHNVIEYDPTFRHRYSKTHIGSRFHQFKILLFNNLVSLPELRKIRIKKLRRILEKNKVELTISTHDFLYPDEVDLIREKSHAPVVIWFPDSVANFNRAFFLISNYNKLFFTDDYIVDILSKNYNKSNVFYLPECCNPKYHKNIILTDDDYNNYSSDISTYGSPHNIRSSFFVQLLNYNYKIKIWGPHTPIWLDNKKIKSLYTGKYVFNESKAKAVLAAKINLNTLLPSEIYGLNARMFEVAGIGGFQITHWRCGLAELFEDGKELVTFNNFNELLERIDYYLLHDLERNNIALAGQIRAYKDHTYKIRLLLLLNSVFKNDV